MTGKPILSDIVDAILESVDINARVRRDWEYLARLCDYRIEVVDEFESLAYANLPANRADHGRLRGRFDDSDDELPPWIQTPDGCIAWFVH